jgi:LysR family transcriptional regulator of abg operon
MKLHQLQALVAVADTGSIRAAARLCGLSQAAVSKALRELEDGQQLALLTRHASGVGLTAQGHVLLKHARLVVGQLAHASAELAALRGESGGSLSISVAPWIAATFLPESVLRFREAMPEVHLEIFEGFTAVALPRLRDGLVDFAISPFTTALPEQEFEIEALFDYRSCIIARRDHACVGKASLHELLDQNWAINFTSTNHADVMHNLFWQHGAMIDPRRLHCAHSSALLLELVRGAGMLSYCPEPLLVAMPARDGIQPIRVCESFETSRLGIIKRHNVVLGRAAKCFVDCLLKVIRQRARSARLEDRALFDCVTMLF